MASSSAASTVRFVIVGVSAAVLQAALAYLLMHQGMRPSFAVLTASATAFVYAYTAQKHWTFASEQSHFRVLPRYLAAQLFCALLAAVVGEVSHQVMLWPDWATAISATLVASAASYLLSSRWVFTD